MSIPWPRLSERGRKGERKRERPRSFLDDLDETTALSGKINGMNDQTTRKSKEVPGKILSIAMGFAPGRTRGDSCVERESRHKMGSIGF